MFVAIVAILIAIVTTARAQDEIDPSAVSCSAQTRVNQNGRYSGCDVAENGKAKFLKSVSEKRCQSYCFDVLEKAARKPASAPKMVELEEIRVSP
jgi:hypothetical protein